MSLNHILWKKNSLGVFFERAILIVADQNGYSLIILGESYIKTNVTYSSVKWSDPGNFLKTRFVIFRCQKYVKKGTWKWKKKFTLRL